MLWMSPAWKSRTREKVYDPDASDLQLQPAAEQSDSKHDERDAGPSRENDKDCNLFGRDAWLGPDREEHRHREHDCATEAEPEAQRIA